MASPEPHEPDALTRMERRTSAASPGPWKASHNYLIGGWWVQNRESMQREGAVAEFTNQANAEFIAHARQDVPNLIAALREALREITRLEAALRVLVAVDPESSTPWDQEERPPICHFCKHYRASGKNLWLLQHDPSCPWLKAQALLKERG